ncbi:MAG: AI-2E family transporter [Actinobacteria bacterium]|nr:AI-2E family transporter [Actinomycetota bacterium]MCB9390446.1 AI-2E family transporter [Acidimicrobiia bacterium]
MGEHSVDSVMAAVDPRPVGPLVTLQVPPRVIAGIVLSVAAALILMATGVAAHRTLGWVIACGLVAIMVMPAIGALSKHMPRWLAMIVSLLAIVAFVIPLVTVVYRSARSEVDDLIEVAPKAARRVESTSTLAKDFGLTDRVQSVVDILDNAVGDAGDILVAAAGTVPTYMVTGVLTLFFIIYGDDYRKGLFRLLPPSRAAFWDRVLVSGVRKGRRYLARELQQAIVVGLVSYLLARGAGLDAAVLLATIVGVFSIVPYFGIVIGSMPALLLAAGTESWGLAGALLVCFTGLQVVEASFFRRHVNSQVMRFGPALTVSVSAIGYSVYGLGGALSCLAIAAMAVGAIDEAGELESEADAAVSPDSASSDAAPLPHIPPETGGASTAPARG